MVDKGVRLNIIDLHYSFDFAEFLGANYIFNKGKWLHDSKDPSPENWETTEEVFLKWETKQDPAK